MFCSISERSIVKSFEHMVNLLRKIKQNIYIFKKKRKLRWMSAITIRTVQFNKVRMAAWSIKEKRKLT